MILELSIALALSVLINLFLGWFGLKSSKDLMFVSGELGDLSERIEEFNGHLEIVYELKTFYGDETLENLLRHAKILSKYMAQFKDITDLSLPEEIEEDIEETDEHNNEEEDNPRQEKTTRKGKTVFYGGP